MVNEGEGGDISHRATLDFPQLMPPYPWKPRRRRLRLDLTVHYEDLQWAARRERGEVTASHRRRVVGEEL